MRLLFLVVITSVKVELVCDFICKNFIEAVEGINNSVAFKKLEVVV